MTEHCPRFFPVFNQTRTNICLFPTSSMDINDPNHSPLNPPQQSFGPLSFVLVKLPPFTMMEQIREWTGERSRVCAWRPAWVYSATVVPEDASQWFPPNACDVEYIVYFCDAEDTYSASTPILHRGGLIQPDSPEVRISLELAGETIMEL